MTDKPLWPSLKPEHNQPKPKHPEVDRHHQELHKPAKPPPKPDHHHKVRAALESLHAFTVEKGHRDDPTVTQAGEVLHETAEPVKAAVPTPTPAPAQTPPKPAPTSAPLPGRSFP